MTNTQPANQTPTATLPPPPAIELPARCASPSIVVITAVQEEVGKRAISVVCGARGIEHDRSSQRSPSPPAPVSQGAATHGLQLGLVRMSVPCPAEVTGWANIGVCCKFATTFPRQSSGGRKQTTCIRDCSIAGNRSAWLLTVSHTLNTLHRGNAGKSIPHAPKKCSARTTNVKLPQFALTENCASRPQLVAGF